MARSIRNRIVTTFSLIALAGLAPALAAWHVSGESPAAVSLGSPALESAATGVRYRTQQVEGLDIFYREAGPADAPVVLLLHGFPTSSHMYRDLIPKLAGQYRVIAPDLPGFGESATPSREAYDYTFANAARLMTGLLDSLGVDRYSVYLMDYGAPVGFRMFEAQPQRVRAFIIQNGNAYDEGLREFWVPIKAYWNEPTQANRDALRGLLTLQATKWQYTHGVRDEQAISPDTWNHVQPKLDRPGNDEVQLDYFYDYRTNTERYAAWQALFRQHQPPTLITWGKGDHIFPAEGAYPYQRDLKNAELHILDTGHFALEEDGDTIARLMLDFLGRHVSGGGR